MARRTRRTVLQLTPLLDLLLIVIFAQYLDVGERDRIREADTRALRAETEQATARVAEAETKFEAEQARRIEAERVAASARESESAARMREREVLRAVAGVFNLPPNQRERLFANDGLFATVPPGDVAAIRQRLGELLEADPDAVRLHLRTHEELRRLSDVWRIHLDPNNVVHFLADGQDTAMVLKPDEFLPAALRWAREQPQTKSLVLVNFSKDELTPLIPAYAISNQLPELIERLRRETESKVDFANLGDQTL